MSRISTPSDLLSIVTLLNPAERTRVDAAGEGYYRTYHHDTIDDVIRELKAHPVQAVLVSVTCAGVQPQRVANLVREFPRVPALALLSEFQSRTAQAVLALGSSGIRRIVDVRLPAGWRELRGALMADSGENSQRTALGQLAIDLVGVSDDCWTFFEILFTCPPRVASVRTLAGHLDVIASTLMSRFYRARLPAPKQYLATARLVRAARLFENAGFSITDVANHLEYSSPQSFSRHVRMLLGVTAGEFRMRYDGAGMFQHFRHTLILPHLEALREIRPLQNPAEWTYVPHSR